MGMAKTAIAAKLVVVLLCAPSATGQPLEPSKNVALNHKQGFAGAAGGVSGVGDLTEPRLVCVRIAPIMQNIVILAVQSAAATLAVHTDP